MDVGLRVRNPGSGFAFDLKNKWLMCSGPPQDCGHMESPGALMTVKARPGVATGLSLLAHAQAPSPAAPLFRLPDWQRPLACSLGWPSCIRQPGVCVHPRSCRSRLKSLEDPHGDFAPCGLSAAAFVALCAGHGSAWGSSVLGLGLNCSSADLLWPQGGGSARSPLGLGWMST